MDHPAELPHSSETKDQEIRVTTRSKQDKQNEELGKDWLLEGWTQEDIRLEQLADINIGPLLIALEEGKGRPAWETVSRGSSSLKTLWAQWDRLEIHLGILYRKFEADNGTVLRQMILPFSKRPEVMTHFHDIPSAGHLGVDKTLEKLKTTFYWPNMRD